MVIYFDCSDKSKKGRIRIKQGQMPEQMLSAGEEMQVAITGKDEPVCRFVNMNETASTVYYTWFAKGKELSKAQAIEEVGSMDTDALVTYYEKTPMKVTSGVWDFDESHDVKWGPGLQTSVGIQWQDGKMKAYWPNGWVPAEGEKPVSYSGMVPLQLPPG